MPRIPSAAVAALVAALAGPAFAGPAEVVGSGPFFHIVGDIDRSVGFYRGLLGLAPGTRQQTFTPDPELQALYNLPGGRESAGVIRIPGTPLSLEFVEWRDVERTPVRPRLQDPGASLLILTVRDVAAVADWLTRHDATILTPGAKPAALAVNGASGRALFAADPDGFFIEAFQPDALGDRGQGSAANVVDAALAVTVADIDRSVRFYRAALGFGFEGSPSFVKDAGWQAATGMRGAEYRRSTATVPGSAVRVELMEFRNIERTTLRPHIQDPGTSMLQLSVRDIAATVSALKDAGGVVITAGGGSTARHGNPISLVREAGSFYLEPMQPGAPAGRGTASSPPQDTSAPGR